MSCAVCSDAPAFLLVVDALDSPGTREELPEVNLYLRVLQLLMFAVRIVIFHTYSHSVALVSFPTHHFR